MLHKGDAEIIICIGRSVSITALIGWPCEKEYEGNVSQSG